MKKTAEQTKSWDYVVLGSGLAGLSFALKASALGKVAVVTKRQSFESSTNHAQGGIASVMDEDDSFELHVKDTLVAGAGLCREASVRTIVEEGPARIRELVDLGMKFSERASDPGPGKKQFDLGREGGHSKRRILHAGDMTGREVERVMLAAAARSRNIRFFENHIAIEIITASKLGLGGADRCVGVYVLDTATGGVSAFAAPVIVLATGGCGKVYLYTTNPDIATGDGVAMAYRAGVPVANMEFIQFHPTCLYHPKAKSFLISEAVRGEGAVLKTLDGAEFMHRYHEMQSLAPRDIVARAIDTEMKRRGENHVLLDISHKPERFLRERFPNIFKTCRQFGINIAREPIPVVPAAHYQCGGIATDVDGVTALPGLYAIGEVACTGLHGANRLASNSLLEALVCAHRAAAHAAARRETRRAAGIPPWQSGKASSSGEKVVISHNWDEIRRLMWDYVGIMRSNKRLARARARIARLTEEIHETYWDFSVTADVVELRNLVLVAGLIVESALQRHESRGLHYNIDCPAQDPAWADRDTVLTKGQEG